MKKRKCLYLRTESTNTKNKGTFFSSTLKVEEKKVPLVFGFLASGLRYGHFVIFKILVLYTYILDIFGQFLGV